jgi:hypothetical protein
MKRLCLASVLVVPACFGGERAETGQCPAGETCSNLTPRGLEFIGASFADTATLAGPSATAIGGTQDVELQYDPTQGFFQRLDLAYAADDDGGIGVKVDHTAGPVVTVRGMGSRTNYLRITDAATGELFDRKQLSGASIDSLGVVAVTTELVPAGLDLAFATGDVHVGVALYGAVQEDSGPQTERLVDQSMQLALAGAAQRGWDQVELPSAVAGEYGLSVTAGNRPAANLDVVVVDHLDSIEADSLNESSVMPNGSSMVCFDGMSGGRYVAGLTWHYTVDEVAEASQLGNCIAVNATQASGTISVVASAYGMSATATLAIGAARTTTPARAVRTARPTAGDRASISIPLR